MMDRRRWWSPLQQQQQQQEWSSSLQLATSPDDDGNNNNGLIEAVGLGIYFAVLSTFVLYNNLVEPWPPSMTKISGTFWMNLHMLGSMLFGGSIVVTTIMEWLIVETRNVDIIQYWFSGQSQVPRQLNTLTVMPGLGLSMVSGTALATTYYGSLSDAPSHITRTLQVLTVFGLW